ncbi:hypothetical protein PF005_g27492 [Phytophthora fragariae]|uniref:Secreted protein n=1 Tax=Phytophthora fragariae TaxID=53985 RepID=A0A6A3VSS0_9STRA|nr:hypothetical protein PF003_g20907 [Phytophthora fragariae]KAE8920145.1 hypothetical protein PF009_g29558 [Phytophthora fragariae]KAE8965614.1 hypothetical protein PF011_g28221 [Phytophthora fragariae]KAE9063818.1 hypothetical protein PF010_g28845 [Phytophthora fragariae]KAE9065136.1 hypothetical protein PF007_g28952 [Phytophthora fragariae]
MFIWCVFMPYCLLKLYADTNIDYFRVHSQGGSTKISICAIKIRNGFTFERDLRGYIFLYFFRLT